ncbi:MAG: glycosyltransferase family 2 protein [Actinobacteria bacterium]|nr:glycosyltransferase family 2 protein [Actinomycetota bacterium]
MERLISVIIPNYNGGATIRKCLEAIFASDFERFEVVVVDDCSTDASVDIIEEFPCELVRLERRSGAAAARNAGARRAKGEALFFIDADCVAHRDTLALVDMTISKHRGERVIAGGTYARIAHDDTFFSTFQSVFVNYFETKSGGEADYIATHALAIERRLFEENHGFDEEFLPILEDVEFSHRLRANGCRLAVNPDIIVGHIFGFSMAKSLRNAYRKTMYWTMYSIGNKDLPADSGTASVALKLNGIAYLLGLPAIVAGLTFENAIFLALGSVFLSAGVFVSRGLLRAFRQAKGWGFATAAALYYLLLYPAPIWGGAFVGTLKYLSRRSFSRRREPDLILARREYG